MEKILVETKTGVFLNEYSVEYFNWYCLDDNGVVDIELVLAFCVQEAFIRPKNDGITFFNPHEMQRPDMPQYNSYKYIIQI